MHQHINTAYKIKSFANLKQKVFIWKTANVPNLYNGITNLTFKYLYLMILHLE